MNKEKNNRRKSKNDENNKKENNLNEEDDFSLKFNTKIEEKNKGYDIVIDIRSFKSLIYNGWRIKFPNGNELKAYEKKKNNETIVVGVIGNGNKGKSFTLQKLSEYKIPKGFSLATEGLSIKYSDLKEKNICILDSAGREGPLIKMVNGEVNEEDFSNENESDDEKNDNNNNDDEEEDVKEDEIVENKINSNVNNRNNKFVKMNSTKNAQKTYKKNVNNINIDNINEVPPLPNQSPNSKNLLHIDNLSDNKDLKKMLKYDEKLSEEEDDEENIEEYSRDKLLTEYFLEKFILQKSNVLIIVVGPMTISEQKLLTKLKNQSFEKDLFIIHNLQNYIYIKQVKNYIKNTLLKLRMIHLKKRIYQNIDYNNNNNENPSKNKIYYIEEKNKKNIIHLILANEYSEAGEYYNTTTISYLKKKIEGIEKRKKFAVIEEIQEFLLKYSNELIEENLKRENIFFDQNKNSIKLKNINNITLKKYLVDELDFNIQKDGYLPKYSYVVKDNKLVIKIELPGGGKIKPSLEITKGDYIFKFEGEKNGDLEIENDSKNNEKKIKLEFNNREKGKYVLNINIPQNVIHINNISNKPKLIEKEKGVFCYEYEVEYLLDKKKEIKNDNEAEDEYNV